MSTREEIVKICDNCLKEKRYPLNGSRCGDNPLGGWLMLKEQKIVGTLDRKGDLDFCKFQCLRDYLDKNPEG